MKTRDEFIKSVREKSEIAIAEKEAARADKKIKKKRIISWSATAAACLVIAVSAGSIGSIGSIVNKGTDGADTAVTLDGATLENTAGTAACFSVHILSVSAHLPSSSPRYFALHCW